jgi:hypothetical protein
MKRARPRAAVVLTDSESSDDDEMSDFIVNDEGEEGSSESEEGSSEDEEGSSEDEEGSSEAGSEAGIAYADWKEMARRYSSGELVGEPTGYQDHPELHVAGWPSVDADALWCSIRVRVSQPGHFEKWGVQAVERNVNGHIERVVHRVKYGWQFHWCKQQICGNYEKAFLPTMLEVFGQAPYQPPLDALDGRLQSPMFLDFEPLYHIDERVDETTRRDSDGGDGPLWCICTQCSAKTLKNLTVMRHTPSGILVVVGGTCAHKMLGHEDPQCIKEQLKDQVHAKTVGMIIDAW